MGDVQDETEARERVQEIRRALEGSNSAIAVAARLNETAVDTGLDLRTTFLVRVAALAASGAPAVSWRTNLELADGSITPDELMATLEAVAPVIGSARYLQAVTAILED
ncbi:MAG: carboxymuconolactone decarboxylase family protein [Microthrixaceae bacterium]